MTATWSGKKPNWPWRGSQAQWDQERSDQIRVGESICPGYERLNPVRFPIFDSQESKDARAKWLSDKKKAKLPPKPVKLRKSVEHLEASEFDLADFM